MSIRYCATASFNRRLEKSQRLLVSYCLRDALRDTKPVNQALPIAPPKAVHSGR